MTYKKIKLVIVPLLLSAIAVRAFEFTQGKVAVQRVPTEYHFSQQEVVDALKAVIQRKYPNADIASTDIKLTWHGLTVAGREKVGGQPLDFVWTSEFPKGCVESNSFALVIYSQPTVPVPTDPKFIISDQAWMMLNSYSVDINK